MPDIADAEPHESELYAERMIEFRNWCETEGIGFKVAVARAIAAWQVKHGSRMNDMGFEIVSFGSNNRGLTPGQCTLQKNGTLSIVNADLINRGITSTTEVVIMVDNLTSRIALRKAREGEPGRKPKLNATKKTASFRISAAVSQTGKKCEEIAKRYAVAVKDDMLIIQL